MPDERTQFDALFSDVEFAAASDNPMLMGYADKRAALFTYVRNLERLAGLKSDNANNINTLDERMTRLERVVASMPKLANNSYGF